MPEPTQIQVDPNISGSDTPDIPSIQESMSPPSSTQDTKPPELSIDELMNSNGESTPDSKIAPVNKTLGAVKPKTALERDNEELDKLKEEKENQEPELDDDEDEDSESEETEAKEKKEAEEPEDKTAKEQTPEEKKLHGNTKRDYKGFDAKEIKLLKRLDESRFEAISSNWRALKEAAGQSVNLAVELEKQKKLMTEGGIPPQWHEHPEAYTLSKEFKDISSQYNKNTVVEDFYQQQLLAVKSGADWHYITGWDAQGNPVYSQSQKASNEGDIYLTRQLSAIAQAKGQLEAKNENLRNNHKQSYEQSSRAVKQEIDGYVNNMHPDLKPLPADEQAVINAIPAQYRDHPLTYGYAKVVGIMFQQARKLKTLMGEKDQAAKIEADKKLAGPRGGKVKLKEPSNSRASANGNMLSIDEIVGKRGEE